MTQRSPFISLLIPGRIFKSQGKTEPPTKMAIIYHQRQTSNIPHGSYQSDKERSDQNLEIGKKVLSTGPTQNAKKKKKKEKEKEFEKRRGRRRRGSGESYSKVASRKETVFSILPLPTNLK